MRQQTSYILKVTHLYNILEWLCFIWRFWWISNESGYRRR